MNKINTDKIYSAREASTLAGFKSELEFREFLRKDIKGDNIFNAKVYTMGSQPRFIIKGSDLIAGLKKLKTK